MPKPTPKEAYVNRIRNALTLTTAEVDKLPREQYIEALEDLVSEVEGMLDAAREEAREAEEG